MIDCKGFKVQAMFLMFSTLKVLIRYLLLILYARTRFNLGFSIENFVRIFMSQPTTFVRAQGVNRRSRLSQEERADFYETMKHSVVMTCSQELASPEQFGTGFMISPDGLILTTANNVIYPELTRVRLFGEEYFRSATVVGLDRQKNMAVLKLAEPVDTNLQFVEILNKKGAVDSGMEVFCIGHPLDLCYSFLIGQVAEPCYYLSQQSIIIQKLRVNPMLEAIIPGIEQGLCEDWLLMKLNNIHGCGSIQGAPIFSSSGSVIGMWAFTLDESDYAFIHSELLIFLNAVRYIEEGSKKLDCI